MHVRNAADHLRRRHRRWGDFGLHVWLAADGSLKGVATLGELGSTEITETLARRWPTTLRIIPVEDLRVEVYWIFRQVCSGQRVARRCQGLSVSIGPRRSVVSRGPVDWTCVGADEAMPVVVG